jgi:hypothetical protein
MARPIEGIRPLSLKAWAWLMDYLKNAKPDPAKAALARRDRAFVRHHIRPLKR